MALPPRCSAALPTQPPAPSRAQPLSPFVELLISGERTSDERISPHSWGSCSRAALDAPGATKHGQLNLSTLAKMSRIGQYEYAVHTGLSSEFAIVLSTTSRAKDWTVDPGSAEARAGWEEALRTFVASAVPVVQATEVVQEA